MSTNKAARGNTAVPTIIVVVHIFVLVWGVLSIPVSWDEGWNYCVARSWLERGHYGCLILGSPTTARLSTGLITVALDVIGFRLFGYNHVSARVMTALLALLALLAFLALVRILWSNAVAVVAVALLLVGASDQRVHPMLLGAQNWGEMPMIFFVTVGYLLLARNSLGPAHNLTRRNFEFVLTTIGTALCFGLARFTKLQAQPFLALATFFPLALALKRECRSAAISLGVSGAISLFVYRMLSSIELPRLTSDGDDGSGVEGIFEAVAKVFDPAIRIRVLTVICENYWFVPLGLACGLVTLIARTKAGDRPERLVLIWSVWIFSSSWFAWFVCGAINFPRYLAPTYFFSAAFVAEFVLQIARFVRARALVSQVARAGLYVGLVAVCAFGLGTIVEIGRFLIAVAPMNLALYQTANYINTRTPENSRIETYETPLFFLLDRPYHYPPDQLNVDCLSPERCANAIKSYRGIEGSQDFVVIGFWAKSIVPLYREALEGAKPLESIGIFDIHRASDQRRYGASEIENDRTN